MANTIVTRTLSFVVYTVWMLTLVKDSESEIQKCPSSCGCSEEFVDCSKQGLVTVPKDIPSWVENLDISFNQLRDNTTDILRELPLISELKLSGNLFTAIPLLGGMGNLAYLSLSHNKITGISREALDGLPSLRTLDLAKNRLVEIVEGGFPRGSSIRRLNLNNNRIATVEKGSLDGLTDLTELKLNHNHLSNFSKEVFKHLKNVNVLELNRNRFSEIEGLSFVGLEALTTLRIRRNFIHTLLDGAFWGLQHMAILQLDHNNISSITKGWLYGLSSLHQLTLSHNRIEYVENDGWEFCSELIELDLSHNALISVEKGTLEHLGKLQRLTLDDNRIAFVADGAFDDTPSLEILEMNGNRISSTIEDMTGAFLGLSRLVEFGLASNHVKSINKRAFLGLERLKKMDLNNNSINSVQDNAFVAMSQLEELVINTTSLLCDCNVRWFPVWLSKTKSPETIIAICAYPEWLKGRAIQDVPTANLTCDDFPIPRLVEDPKTQIALKGTNVTLQCKASSSTVMSMTFQWKRDNADLVDGNVKQFVRSPGGKGVEQTSQLILSNISHNDAGKYQCVISNSYGTTYSSKAKITVLIFPSFAKIPGNVTVKSSTTARLDCAARGQPHPQIAWQKDGGNDFPAARERRMHFMPTDDAFFIVDVRASDTGVYSCTAQNLAGVIVANASLTVIESPAFVKPMENKEITAGEPIVLECMASGSPKPKLTWTKDGGSLVTTERHFFTADDQLLIIVDTAVSDGGTYECTMSNPLGSVRGHSHLSVVPASGSSINENDMTGIIIITVVCCAVGTSIVWVVIIHQTRKRGAGAGGASQDRGPRYLGTTLLPGLDVDFKGSLPQLYLDTNSEHSSGKDSGTGDSAKRSSDDLLLANDLDLDVTGGSNESLEMSTLPTSSCERSPSPTTESGRRPRRTDHDRCDGGSEAPRTGERWSTPQYAPVPVVPLGRVSYHGLQPPRCAATTLPR